MNYGGLISLGVITMGFCFLGYGIKNIAAALNNLTANLSQFNMRYYLCQYGLLCIKGRQVQGIRWDQVNAVQKILFSGTQTPYQYIFHAPTIQEPFVLGKVGNSFKALGLKIEEQIARNLLPTSITAYKAGQTLDFGAIDVTPEGLSLKEETKTLAWEDIGNIDMCKDAFVIRRKYTQAEQC